MTGSVWTLWVRDGRGLGHSEHFNLNLKVIAKYILCREGVRGEVVPPLGGIGSWRMTRSTWIL